MAWNDAVITLGGLSLMADVLNGEELTITRAEVSENTVNVAALMMQKAILSPMNVPVAFSKIEKRENSVSIGVQVRNTGVVGSHRMRQVGLYAQTETSKETLFAILQYDIGDDIPPEAEYPKFLLELGVVVYVSNADSVEVVIDPTSVIVTKADLDKALGDMSQFGVAFEEIIEQHDGSETAHPFFLEEIESLKDRMRAVELACGAIASNSFAVTFGSLYGTTTTDGIWNVAEHRLEF